MKTVHLSKLGDFNDWRNKARFLIHSATRPEEIIWLSDQEQSLFSNDAVARENSSSTTIYVPKQFLSLAEKVICHSGKDTPSLLYRILFRLQKDKQLLEKIFDNDVVDAHSREKSVNHDIHMMHAFVRFKEVLVKRKRRCFTAWYEPQHFIVKHAAPFFSRRFKDMDWQILTPKGSAYFFDERLEFGAPVYTKPKNEDATEELWKTYFSSIFNPARLNTKAMKSHMPKKFWHNLPETGVINNLVEQGCERVEAMCVQQSNEAPLFHQRLHIQQPTSLAVDKIDTFGKLKQSINDCRRCPLYCHATQAIHGEGPENANIMIVGEQPGDREDLLGRPFVGPAGQLLDRIGTKVGLDRKNSYITNAVKHFKYELRGKKRIHNTANHSEIEQCRWWLQKEVNVIQPKLIVTMGRTAFFSLTGEMISIEESRGKIFNLAHMPPVLATMHPSYLLRLKNKNLFDEQLSYFENDMMLAIKFIASAAL